MPSRYVCSALKEMRQLVKKKNYRPLPGLIEEIQWMVNRMEAGLMDLNTQKRLRKKRKGLEKEIKALEKKKIGLQKELGIEPEKKDNYDY